MLLPVAIEHPYQRTPYATYSVLGSCVAIWLAQVALPEGSFDAFVLSPTRFAPHQLITSAFLHLGWLHLAGNMLYLWVFGRYVEERLGAWRFLALYGATEVVASLAYLAGESSRGSGVEALLAPPRDCAGASGAISGLMGFVLVTAPWVQVRTYFLLHVKISEPIHIGAFFIVGWGLLLDVIGLQWARQSGVAVLAHLGGAAAGVGIGALLRSARMRGSPWYVDPAPPGGGVEATRRLARARGAAARGRADRGHADGEPQVEVGIQHIPAGVSRVGVVKLLMAHAGLEPDDAMGMVEQVCAGTPAIARFPDVAAAQAFVAGARALELGVSLRTPTPRG